MEQKSTGGGDGVDSAHGDPPIADTNIVGSAGLQAEATVVEDPSLNATKQDVHADGPAAAAVVDNAPPAAFDHAATSVDDNVDTPADGHAARGGVEPDAYVVDKVVHEVGPQVVTGAPVADNNKESSDIPDGDGGVGCTMDSPLATVMSTQDTGKDP
jgi:hypothetical protein